MHIIESFASSVAGSAFATSVQQHFTSLKERFGGGADLGAVAGDHRLDANDVTGSGKFRGLVLGYIVTDFCK